MKSVDEQKVPSVFDVEHKRAARQNLSKLQYLNGTVDPSIKTSDNVRDIIIFLEGLRLM